MMNQRGGGEGGKVKVLLRPCPVSLVAAPRYYTITRPHIYIFT